jgi:hypothetical protein
MGDYGFICQVKKWGGWSDLGVRYVRSTPRGNTYEENGWTNRCTGSQEAAECRLNHEVQLYSADLERQHQLRAFKPKVVREWP